VPEVHDGVVEMKAQAREAGARSKVAVHSRQENVDPVGACVGHRGSRVQAVVDELRGEKVDIVRWGEEPAKYVASALSPAKVSRVIIDEKTRSATVVAPDNQLSLAIGREGQNVRLAARLTGWRIDIRSEAQMAELEAAQAAAQAAEAAQPAEEAQEAVAMAPEQAEDAAQAAETEQPAEEAASGMAEEPAPGMAEEAGTPEPVPTPPEPRTEEASPAEVAVAGDASRTAQEA